MDRREHRRAAALMRGLFRELDLIGLGEFPADEYDAVADTATSFLGNGGTAEEAVSRVDERFRADWDAELSRSSRRSLLAALDRHRDQVYEEFAG